MRHFPTVIIVWLLDVRQGISTTFGECTSPSPSSLGDPEDDSAGSVKRVEWTQMEELLCKELAGFLNAMVEFSLSKVSTLQLEHLYKGPSPDTKGVLGTW